jgi:hypothetical protein
VAINHVELSPPVELRDDQSYGSSDGEVFDDVRQDFEETGPSSENDQ